MGKNSLTMEVERLKREFYEGMKELQEKQEKTDEQISRTEKEIEKTNKMVGKLTDGWGEFVDGLIEPNVYSRFQEKGITVIGTFPGATRHLNGETIEIDILAVGKMGKEDVVLFVEAKTRPSQKDVKELIAHIQAFPRFFEEYKGRKIMGVLGGMKVSRGVKEYAEKCGFYVLAPSGDTMVIANKPSFKPTVWK